MSSQTLASTTARIGKIKGAMLKHAEPVMALAISGGKEKMPKNQGRQIIYRRYLPYGGSAAAINTWSVDPASHQLSEGMTPNVESVTPHDVPVTIDEYGCLYGYTNRVADLFEDDIPREEMIQCAQRTGLLKEMISYGALKSCTNKFYAGGASRATVDETISLGLLRNISRTIIANLGRTVTSVLAPGVGFNTMGVEQAFLVFCHSDMEHDIRQIPGFRETVAYGTRKTVHEMEIGAVDRYRFIISPHMAPYADAGAAAVGTGLVSTSGSNIDVYPVVVIGADSWADLALRGANAMSPSHIPVGTKSKSDPLGQRGYVSNQFYGAAFIKNDFWMAVAECGATDL